MVPGTWGRPLPRSRSTSHLVRTLLLPLGVSAKCLARIPVAPGPAPWHLPSRQCREPGGVFEEEWVGSVSGSLWQLRHGGENTIYGGVTRRPWNPNSAVAPFSAKCKSSCPLASMCTPCPTGDPVSSPFSLGLGVPQPQRYRLRPGGWGPLSPPHAQTGAGRVDATASSSSAPCAPPPPGHS